MRPCAFDVEALIRRARRSVNGREEPVESTAHVSDELERFRLPAREIEVLGLVRTPSDR